MKIAESGTVFRRSPAKNALRIVEDDEREHDAHAHKRQPLQRRPVSHRRSAHRRRAPASRSRRERQHREELAEERAERHLHVQGLPDRQFQSSDRADGIVSPARRHESPVSVTESAVEARAEVTVGVRDTRQSGRRRPGARLAATSGPRRNTDAMPIAIGGRSTSGPTSPTRHEGIG